MTTTVEMIFRLEPPIAATRDVAGKQYSIHLESGPAKVTLPVEHGSPEHSPPAILSGWPSFPGKRQPTPLRPLGTGFVTGSAEVLPSSEQLNIEAMLCRAVVEEESIGKGLIGFTLAQTFGDWLEIVRSWVGVWTGAPQTTLMRKDHPEMLGVYRSNEQWTRVHAKGQHSTLVLGHPLASPDQLRAAFCSASVGVGLPVDLRSAVTVPLEHRMLVQARTHTYLGDGRSSVIDACCAAELGLGTAIRKTMRHRGTEDKVLALLMARTSGIVEMFRLYLAACGSTISQERVADQLAGPRNRAAHDAVPPSEKEVDGAIATATAVLTEASPLSSPSEVIRIASATTRLAAVSQADGPQEQE